MKILKNIIEDLSKDYTQEDMRDKHYMADQLRTRADDDELLENKIFEVGVSEVVKGCKKQTLGSDELPLEYYDTMSYYHSDLKKVNSLKDSKLYLIDSINWDNGGKAIRFTFRRKDGKYISLMLHTDDALLLSKAY